MIVVLDKKYSTNRYLASMSEQQAKRAKMSSGGDWCLIESDPGVFTELIKGFGVKGVQLEELWSLDPDSFEKLRPVHGLIFLFKWKQDDEPAGSVVQDSRLDNIFFAKQVINNACATQAILSILLNCKHDHIELGETLSNFKSFTQTFDPGLKGLAISNSDQIREVHNSFSRQQLFEFDQKSADKDDDVFHFVGYIPVDGRLYELDGLKDGPLDHGAIPAGSDWLDSARPVIQKRIEKSRSRSNDRRRSYSRSRSRGRYSNSRSRSPRRRSGSGRRSRYSSSEIHFNLMAVVSDRKMIYEQNIQQIRTAMATGMETSEQESEISKLQILIKDEEAKTIRYKKENIRRRHNYLPFIMELLKVLAQQGKLVELTQLAKQKTAEKNKEKEAKKEIKQEVK